MSKYGSEQRGINAGAPKSLGELTSGAGVEIEPVTTMDGVALEKFMNELVTIFVHKTKEKGSLTVINPSVGGINMPIVRGVATPVKRKYVEALIHAHNVDYVQEVNQQSPDQYEMRRTATPSYPFDVVADTQAGFIWKRQLEAALDAQV